MCYNKLKKGCDIMDNYEIVKFVDDEFELDVRTDKVNDTVWLNTDEIALLFNRDYTTIRKHINNALKEELDEKVVVAKFASTTKHGAMKDNVQTHDMNFYNLDVIISVGYRVKSERGVLFRKWANKLLKEYLIQGYSINNKRLETLNKVIDIQNKMLASVLNIDSYELSEVIKTYTNALDLLDDYDHQRINKPKGNDTIYKIEYDEARQIIDSMKFKNDSNLFGVEK